MSARGLGGGGVAGSLDSQVACHQLVSVTVCIDRCGVTIHTHQVVSQTTTTRLRQIGDPLFFTRVAHFMAESSWQPVMSAAQRRRQRRLRSWWRHEQQSIAAALATLQHHSAPWGTEDGHGEEGDFELNFAAKIRRHPPPQAAGTVCYPMDVDDVPAASGSRPDRLLDVSGLQERVQRRTMEQIVDCVPVVPLLDAPVPQTVDQLVEVLRPLDTVVPEQVIEAPKITLHDAIPQRAVLRVPQMAEQLVDEPVPSFDDFELVEVGEEEEEEEEPPRMVPGSRVWCRVAGPAGVYWWMIGTSTAQHNSPEGLTARPGRYRNTGQGSRVTSLLSCSSSSSSPRCVQGASASVHRQSGGYFSCFTETGLPVQTVQQTMEISQVPFLALLLTRPLLCNDRCLGAHAWFDSGYIFCVSSRRALWEDFLYFLREGGTLDPQVDSCFFLQTWPKR